MGEYALYRGNRIKIGTCEDMYYLRWDQRDQVTPLEGNLDPTTHLDVIRFRFPFPAEDGMAPGEFDDHDKGFRLDGFEQPKNMDHGSVQFSARNGYLVSLPCPEAGAVAGYTVHKNGYGGPASLVQQGWRGGRLVGIARCNGCHRAYRLEDGYEEAAAVAIRAQADRIVRTGRADCTEGDAASARRIHEIADRLLAGYAVRAAA